MFFTTNVTDYIKKYKNGEKQVMEFWRAKFHIEIKWLTPISAQFKFILEYYTVNINKLHL